MARRMVRFIGISLFIVIQVSPIVKGQDPANDARDLEIAALKVWQLTQFQFDDLNNRRRVSEVDSELYVDLGAFSRSTSLYRELSSRLNRRQLRGAVQSLVMQAVELEYLFAETGLHRSIAREWRQVQHYLRSIARANDVSYAPEGRRVPEDSGERDLQAPRKELESFHWRGRVDGKDYVQLSGDRVLIDHVNASPIRDDSHELSSPLPRRSVTIRLEKIRGRGRVEIVEQPSARNGFTVIVLLEDKKSGSAIYEFELNWDASDPVSQIPHRP